MPPLEEHSTNLQVYRTEFMRAVSLYNDAVHSDDRVVDLDEAVRLRLAARDEADDLVFNVELDAEARGAAACGDAERRRRRGQQRKP